MDAEHILANVRHLHSDVANTTIQVVERLNQVAKIVTDSAAKVEQSRTHMNRERESMLIGRIKELEATIEALKAGNGETDKRKEQQIAGALAPVLAEMSKHSKTLADSQSTAWQFMKSTEGNQSAFTRMVQRVIYAALGGAVLLVGLGVVIGVVATRH